MLKVKEANPASKRYKQSSFALVAFLFKKAS